MKNFKITDGFLHDIERKLQELAETEYRGADGIYVSVDGLEIVAWDEGDFSLDLKVRWGNIVDGKVMFEHQATLTLVNNNLDFIAGQFFVEMLKADGN